MQVLLLGTRESYERNADLSKGLEVGPSQTDAALLALHILHLIVASGQVSHTHLSSPVHQHQSRHEEKAVCIWKPSLSGTEQQNNI